MPEPLFRAADLPLELGLFSLWQLRKVLMRLTEAAQEGATGCCLRKTGNRLCASLSAPRFIMLMRIEATAA